MSNIIGKRKEKERIGIYMTNQKITSELIKRAKKNDQEAFADIVQLTEKKAYFVAYSDLRSKEAAEDVVQEAYMTAFRTLDSLEDESKFEAWFQRILKNKIIDNTRKRATKEDKQTSLFSSLSDDESDLDFESNITNNHEEWDPRHNMAQKLIQEGLNQIFEEELNVSQRMALRQHFYENMSIREIAEEQQVSINTVGGWIRYGKNTIKKKIEEMRAQGASFYAAMPLSLLLQNYFDAMEKDMAVPYLEIKAEALRQAGAKATEMRGLHGKRGSIQQEYGTPQHNAKTTASRSCSTNTGVSKTSGIHISKKATKGVLSKLTNGIYIGSLGLGVALGVVAIASAFNPTEDASAAMDETQETDSISTEQPEIFACTPDEYPTERFYFDQALGLEEMVNASLMQYNELHPYFDASTGQVYPRGGNIYMLRGTASSPEKIKEEFPDAPDGTTMVSEVGCDYERDFVLAHLPTTYD